MSRFLTLFSLILCFSCFILCFSSESHAVSVCYVTDGNTFLTCDGRKIVLSGVEAPSLSKPYGSASRDYLLQLIQNKDVTLRCPSSGQLPTYPGTTITYTSGTCYALRILTVYNGGVAQTYRSYVPCEDLLTSTEPQVCGVSTGPIDVVNAMVSQGWAMDVSGQYASSQKFARSLRLGLWHGN